MLGGIRRIKRALPPVHKNLQLLNIPLGDNTRITPLQLALHLQLIQSLLMSTFCFLDLTFCLEHVHLRTEYGGINFRDLSPCRL